MAFRLSDQAIAEHNAPRLAWLEEDYAHLGRQLARRGVEIERLTGRATASRVAVPSWGVGTGGTRFARFAGPGEPRDVFEKLDDCEAIHKLVRVTPAISLHIPWDEPEDPAGLREFAAKRGLSFDSMNSNTFQDQPGQKLSYKFGSLTHVDPAVRRQAVEHNLHCLELGRQLGARSHTVWIGDGGNFPGQVHFRRALDRYLESLRAILLATRGAKAVPLTRVPANETWSCSTAREARKSGMPIVRPLFLIEPQAAAAWSNWWTYLYGPDILVSPIWQKEQRTQQVYMPTGNKWRDAWNPDKIYDGGQTITVNSELHQLPIFVRVGSKVELGDLNKEWSESTAIADTRPDLAKLDAELKAWFDKRFTK